MIEFNIFSAESALRNKKGEFNFFGTGGFNMRC